MLLEPAVLVNSFDVTSLKQLEEELEDTRKQLLMYVPQQECASVWQPVPGFSDLALLVAMHCS